MKKWWFSIVMFVFALIILTYGIVVLCLGEMELFYQSSSLASYSTLALMALLIGLANTPNKEKK